MFAKPVTVTRLERLLTKLGFVKQATPGRHILFEHPDSHAGFLLRWYEPGQPLYQPHLAMVRRGLVERGFMTREEFEKWVRQARPTKKRRTA